VPPSEPLPHVCLVILDGYGTAPPGPGNAISLADTPVFDDLCARYPHTQLQASGAAVGLPAGQMGNSEVGHLTIGAGAIVKQHLTLIDEAAASGGFARNAILRDAFDGTDRVHLVGLVSTGGVHSSFQHLTALIDLAAELSVPDLVLHCITDGRDTSPTSGTGFLERVQQHCERARCGRIATVAGRFWMMDRDHRWDRVQRAYDLLVHGRAERHVGRAMDAAREAYVRGQTDEFIPPTTVSAEGRIRPDDSVVCFNFRPDRMRELVRALAEPGMTDIHRGGTAPVAHLTTMTSYEDDFPYPIAFPPVHPPDTLAAAVSRAGLTQLHVAETEKYAHVTYFLGGGREEPVPGEQRRLVPSVRDVATYDLAPAMSADAIVEAFRVGFAEEHPQLTVINFANPDMVGHTGVIPATVRAVEVADRCLGEVVEEITAAGGACVITADHGNAEQMLDGTAPSTAHSTNSVPLVVTVPDARLARTGGLADVAPTVLDLLGIPQPPGMTGHSLLR
jgi:2,3-bisphosphoglycerate-independent phosphoglycerate mutase